MLNNDQAKALAEKVWGKYFIVEYWSAIDGYGDDQRKTRYRVGCGDANDGTLYSCSEGIGDSWESAFKAAGVDVCCVDGLCEGRYSAGLYEGDQPCPKCNGLGYRLLEKKP